MQDRLYRLALTCDVDPIGLTEVDFAQMDRHRNGIFGQAPLATPKRDFLVCACYGQNVQETHADRLVGDTEIFADFPVGAPKLRKLVDLIGIDLNEWPSHVVTEPYSATRPRHRNTGNSPSTSSVRP